MKATRKSTAILLLFIIMAVLAAGCGSSGGSGGEVKTVTDCAGRTVEIPENPQRVACMYASTAHMMAMLDQGDKIIGTPNGVKTDVLMQMKYPEIAKTATPYQGGAINAEELLRIEADLVLVRRSTAENEGEIEKLDKLDIPYVVVDYINIEELKEAISVMGQVFGEEEKADAYLEHFERTIDLVQERLKGIDDGKKPEVFHSVNEAIRTDAAGDICCEIMELAGVKDLSAVKEIKAGGDKTLVTLEEIYQWDPEYILANEYSVTDYILSDSKWKSLKAVKNKQVYTLPVGATRWCHPGSMEAHMGVLAIAKQFYPEEMKDIDLKEYIGDYYKTYFGLDLEDKVIDRIIKGEGMRISNAAVR